MKLFSFKNAKYFIFGLGLLIVGLAAYGLTDSCWNNDVCFGDKNKPARSGWANALGIFYRSIYYLFPGPDAINMTLKLREPSLYLASALSPIFIFSAFLSTFWLFAGAAYGRFRMRFAKNHILIFGGGKRAKAFLGCDQCASMYFIAPTIEPETLAALKESKRLYLLADPFSESTFTKYNAAKAKHIIVAGDDDIDNLNLGQALKSYIPATQNQLIDQTIHVITENADLETLVTPNTRQKTPKGELRIDLISQQEMTARMFVRQHRLFEAALAANQDRLNLIFFRFGSYSKEIMWQALMANVHSKLELPVITIVHSDKKRVEAALRHDVPELDLVGTFKFKTPAELTFSDINPKLTTAIFVERRDDQESLAEALELRRRAIDIPEWAAPIFFLSKEHSGFGGSGSGDTAPVYGFGQVDAMCRVPHVTGGYDEFAEMIHEAYAAGEYNDEPDGPNAPWARLGESYRHANRRAAAHVPAKLGSVGIRLLSPGEPFPVINEGTLTHPAERLEELSKLEHDAWNLERRLNGWQFGNERSDRLRTNPSLVEYDELEDNVKQYDRDHISVIEKALKK